MLKVVSDDGDAEEKLDRITAKADQLRAEHPALKIRIDTAEATAKMAVFRDELKAATRTATEEIKVKVSDRSIAESEAKIGILKRPSANRCAKGMKRLPAPNMATRPVEVFHPR
jgi:cell division septum initiation protein DivIVA